MATIRFHLLIFMFVLIFCPDPAREKLESNENDNVVHSCPICYDALDMIESKNSTNTSNTAFLTCNHQLCIQCWVECLSQEMYTCPICRDKRLQDYIFLPFAEVSLKNIIRAKNYSSEKLSHFFFSSVVYGRISLAQYLLKKFERKVNVNLQDKDGYTPLQGAIVSAKIEPEKKLELLQFLIEEAKADENILSEREETLLHYAAFYGVEEIMEYLFENNLVDINATDIDFNTPILHLIASPVNDCENKKLRILKYFIEEQNANVDLPNIDGFTAFSFSIKYGYFEIFQYLSNIVNTTDENYELFNTLNSDQFNETIKLKIIKIFMEKNEDAIFITNREGSSLVHMAAYYGYKEILKYLLKFIDVNIQDDEGTTPVMDLIFSYSLVEDEKIEMLDFLNYNYNVDFLLQNDHKNTSAFLFTIVFGELKIIEWFLNFTNANIFQVDSLGNNALMISVLSESISREEEKLENIKFLMDNTEISIYEVNTFGYSALHLSTHFGYIQILDYLLQNTNLNINQRDFMENTPIEQAFLSPRLEENEKFEVIKFYLQSGHELDFNMFHDNKTEGNILYTCFLFGYFNICEHLLIHTNININAQNHIGNSNLYALISSGREEDEKLKCLKEIVDNHGANVFLLNKKGENILHLSAAIGDRNILSYLINVKNMNVNQQDSFGNTPLMYALYQNDTVKKKHEILIWYIVKDLIEIHGANPRLKNFEAVSPMFLSFQKNYDKISEYLMKCPTIFTKDNGFKMILEKNKSTLKIVGDLLQSLDEILHTGDNILEYMNATLQENNALLHENTTKN